MPVTITNYTAADLERRLAEMGAMMAACVRDGASIGYILPFEEADGAAFWRNKVLPSLAEGGTLLLVAELDDGRIAGTVQLGYDTPPNQPHRADVRKMLVHPDFRRRGIARALMESLEREARRLNRSLLTLDTRTGDAAEPLYLSLGYRISGVIPGFCIDAIDQTRQDSTTIMYKRI